MTTIPSRLAKLSRSSGSPAEARKRAIQLYREWYRSAPEIVTLYGLNVSPLEIRHNIRQKFEETRNVTDPRAVDILLHKATVDLQEVLNCWKQEPHILGIMLAQRTNPPRTFLQKFYEGRDEDQVLPASP